MYSLVAKVGERLSERWLALLILPGLAFAAAAYCALVLRQAHALDTARLAHHLSATANSLKGRPARIGVAAVLMLLAANAAALAGRASAHVTLEFWLRGWSLGLHKRLESLVSARWPGSRTSRLLRTRRQRAENAARSANIKPVEAYLPCRPTWMGDRVHLLAARVQGQYGVDISSVWPRIWQLIDDSARAPLHAARGRFADAAALAGWGLLYLILGVWWWPALAVGLTAVLLGWRRARNNLADYATLIEATTDIYIHKLAESLRTDPAADRLTHQDGAIINDILNKGS